MSEPTLSERIAEKITTWSGSMPFLLLNAAVFALWILVNTLTPWQFDAFPFNLLTMSVSLEAIFLAVFVLISENRRSEIDRRTVERDAATNRQAAQEIGDIKQDMETIKRMLAKIVVEGGQASE